MKKDFIRDYATEAFRYYASCGCKTAGEIKEQIYQKIFEQSKKDYETITKDCSYSSSVEYALIQAESAIEHHTAELRDILAVEQTLRILEVKRLKSVIEAIEIVYFAEPEHQLKRNNISDRVHIAELTIPASERQIYYWLKKARYIFAENRGLRTS